MGFPSLNQRMMRRFIYAVLLGWLLVVAVVAAVTFTGFRYASEPGAGKVLNRNRPSPEAYSLWERSFTKEQSAVCSRPRKGAGCSRQRDISERCGRHSQWTTGRHERLRGRPGPAGKGNHQPARRSSVECHDWRSYVSEKGSCFDTGLDVPRGEWMALGMSISISHRRIRVGITWGCVSRHRGCEDRPGGRRRAQSGSERGNAARAGNKLAYFVHTDVQPLDNVPQNRHVRSRPWRAAKKRCRISRHSRRRWDTALMMWPRGTSIRSSGNFMAGPFPWPHISEQQRSCAQFRLVTAGRQKSRSVRH